MNPLRRLIDISSENKSQDHETGELFLVISELLFMFSCLLTLYDHMQFIHILIFLIDIQTITSIRSYMKNTIKENITTDNDIRRILKLRNIRLFVGFIFSLYNLTVTNKHINYYMLLTISIYNCICFILYLANKVIN